MANAYYSLEQYECEALWGYPECAEYLGISEHTLRRWRRKGIAPPSKRLGGVVRFVPEAARAWVLGQADDVARETGSP